jgi:disulfide bond formation protein DsbB
MPTRLLYLFAFLFISSLLVFSLYLQFYQDIIPCPLCTMQRLCFAILSLLFLLGFLFYQCRYSRLVIHLLGIITTLGGIFFAGRQLWLQLVAPVSKDECGVSLQYMLKVLPVTEVMKKILAGTAECSTFTWQFLSLNMAEWALICFILLLALLLYLMMNKPHSRP